MNHTQPAQALNNALYSNAEIAKASYREELEELLRARIDVAIPEQISGEVSANLLETFEVGIAPTVHWHTFACNHIESSNAEVMTAWALGPNDKSVVFAQFLAVAEEWNRFDSGLASVIAAARTSLQGARDAANAFVVDELVFRWRESMDKTNEDLDKLAAQVRSGDPDYRATGQMIIGQFKSQRDLLVAAEKRATRTQTTDRKAIADLRERLEENIARLEQEKGLDADSVKNLVLSSANPEVRAVGTLRSSLQSEARDAAKRAEESKQSVIDFQSKFDERATQSKEFYQQRAYAK